MALFGRKAKGRHALGAAVTSIPSGPLQGFAPPVVVSAPIPAAPVAEVPAAVSSSPVAAPPAEPDPMSSIAGLIATGEAWAVQPAVLDELPRLLPTPVEAPAPAVTAPPVAAPEPPAAPPAPTQPAVSAVPVATPVTPLPIAAPGPIPAPSPAVAPAPVAPAPAAAPARSSLQAALAELLPTQGHQEAVAAEAAPPVPAVAPPARVQLGFRDGTSTTLDPGSDQALALEQLAQTLTQRD